MRRAFAGVRWALALLALGWVSIAFVQLAKINTPYEDWDEIGTFNNAAVMWSPLRTRTYAYGFLDTAKMALGRRLHEGPLTPGYCMGERIYSNNVPASFDSTGFDVAQRNWVGLSAIDFNYFRGLVDRRGLFYARLINIACLLLLAIGVLLVLEVMMGGWAMASGSIALFWLITGHEFVSQSLLALPNAVNTLLALLVALLSGGAIIRSQWPWLALATVATALGFGHKIDFLALGLPVAAAFLMLAVRHRHRPGHVVVMGGLLLLCFVGSILLSDPYLLVGPVAEITQQIAVVRSITAAAVDVPQNWTIFGTFVARQFSTSSAGAAATPIALWSGGIVWVLAWSL
jgi:hypothetical protein